MDRNQLQGGENQEENHILKMKCKLYTIWEIQVQLCQEIRTQAVKNTQDQSIYKQYKSLWRRPISYLILINGDFNSHMSNFNSDLGLALSIHGGLVGAIWQMC